MALVTLHSVSIAFGGPPVLADASLQIEEGDRICITGRNGEGKSTLLKVLAGILRPDAGEVLRAQGLRCAYLSQAVPADEPGTAEEVAQAGVEGAPEPDVLAVRRFLSQLGVCRDALFRSLSGGQRRRVKLAAALAADPTLLLLDEPTNHLDVETIEWLEAHLARATCACAFVTHDRAFLRRTARRVFDLDRGRLAGWNCGYEEFLRRKADLEAEEERLWERKKKRLAAEEHWIVHGVTARRSRNRGRLELLFKLRDEIASRRAKLGTSTMTLGESAQSGELVAKLEDVSFSYPSEGEEGARPMVRDFSATILRGERIGVLGPNGAGKTTLLNLLLGRLAPTAGSVRLGARVEPVFFDQLRTTLDPGRTVVDALADGRDRVVIGGITRHVYGYLADFLFPPERARTPVGALSGGERARLLLARLFLAPGNLLVMDEPTNDLDVETLELLEERLLEYPGTILLVSHDREFLDHVVTSSYVLLGDGRVHICPGGYADWERERAAVLGAGAAKAPEAVLASAPAAPAPKITKKRLGFNEKREWESLPGEIEALEKEIAALEAALSDGTVYARDPAKAKADAARLPEAREALEGKIARWMELGERS